MTLIMEPALIIADECIAALDVSIQAQVVNMLRRIKEEYGASFLFISHDLSMVRYLSDHIGVLHREYGCDIRFCNHLSKGQKWILKLFFQI